MGTLTQTERDYLLTTTEREVAIRLEIVKRSNGELVYAIDTREDSDVQLLPGGSVRVDPNAEVLRTADLSLTDPYKRLGVGIGQVIGLSNRYKLYKGYWIDGAWHMFPLGVYELSGRPQVVAPGGVRTLRFQLADKSSNANRRPRGGLRHALRVTQGMTKLQAIQAIAGVETWGETQFNFWQGSTATLPRDYAWDSNASPWQAAQDIANIVEPDGTITRLYYDPLGRLTLTPDPGPNLDQLPAVWTASPNPDGLSQLQDASREIDPFSMTNAVQVNYGSQYVTPGVAWSIDNDPNSETSVDNIGWLIYQWKNGAQDDLIFTLAEAQARADFERQRRRSNEDRSPFSILENLSLEPWDVVHLEYDRGDLLGNYQLLSHTIPLDGNLIMQCEGWRTNRVV